MILRKLSEAIQEQNWFTVLLEILIVVIGIFLGLQVDDWNERRKDRIDEQLYLIRLHNDILNVEGQSRRLLERRISAMEEVRSAIDLIYSQDKRENLTEDECSIISSSHIFNIATSDLPAAIELNASGRMGILRDAELRTALGELQQANAALKTYLLTQNSITYDLVHLYPNIIDRDAYLETNIGEVRMKISCDLQSMRRNRSFLDTLSLNLDAYDAYVRDGVGPWADKLSRTHILIDKNLHITHEEMVPE